MSKAKAISQMQNVVKELGEKNMDGVFTYDDTSCFCTGYLYEFTENSVFGEFAALHILPKRIYDAVSMCETELWAMRRKDLLDAFTGPDEYVLAHITRVAHRHLRWIKSRNKIVKKAIQIYGQTAESSYGDSVRSISPLHANSPKGSFSSIASIASRMGESKIDDSKTEDGEGSSSTNQERTENQERSSPTNQEESSSTNQNKEHVRKLYSGTKAFLQLISNRRTKETTREVESERAKRVELEQLSLRIAERVTSKLMDRINQVEEGLSERLKNIEHEMLHFDEAVM